MCFVLCKEDMRLGYGSVVKQLASVHKALCLSPSTRRREMRKRRNSLSEVMEREKDGGRETRQKGVYFYWLPRED